MSISTLAIEHRLERLISFLSQTSNLDKSYRTFVYTGRIILAYLSNSPPDSVGALIADRLSRLLAPFSEVRVIFRLAGLLSTTQSLLNHLRKTGAKQDTMGMRAEDIEWWLGLWQCLSMLIYYPMEHVYWLGLRGVINIDKDLGAWLSKTSSQAWLVYIMLDAIAVARASSRLYHRTAYIWWDLVQTIGGSRLRRLLTSTESDPTLSEIQTKQIETLKAAMPEVFGLMHNWLLILGDLPLALTWSRKHSFLSPLWIGIFGSISSIVGLCGKWRAFRAS